jgi:HEAT repeat protein
VRRFAAEALGWVGGATVVPALNQATADPVAEVRRYAAIQLGKIADPSSLEALSAMLDETPDPDADVRWAAVVALGKLNDKRAEKVLVQALADSSPQVVNSAERALQRLGIARHERAGFEG